MKISISPDAEALVLIIIVLANFILGFGKNKIMKSIYIIISSFLSVLGLIGIILIRPLLSSRLNRKLNNGRLNADFITWALDKFDFYAVISIITTCFVILFLIIILLINKRNEKNIVWNNLSGIVNVFRAIIIFVEVLYTLEIINNLFDVSSYIAILSFSEIFLLYIPLVMKRIIIYKKSDYVSKST